MSSLSVGIILAIIAGGLNGSFAAPTKYAKVWKWENIYSVWAIFGMVVFPWAVVFADHSQSLGGLSRSGR